MRNGLRFGFGVLVTLAFAACGDDETSTVPGNTADAGQTSDSGTSDTGTTDTGTTDAGTTDTGAVDVATEDTSVAPLSELVASLTQPCYDSCLLGSGCSIEDWPELGDCEDECDIDTGYILGNAADAAADRACIEAMVQVEEWIGALNCTDLDTWSQSDSGTYPCSTADVAEARAWTGIGWYENL